MSRGSNVDTTIVIKARDEAARTINGIEAALADLLGTQKDLATGSTATATGIKKIVGTLADLDAAYFAVAGSQDKAAAATKRQLAALAQNQSQVDALNKQLTAAKALQERNAGFVGPRTPDQTARFAAVGAEVQNLQRSIRTLERNIDRLDSAATKSASDLGELARAERLASAVTTFATEAANEHTAALEREASAAAKVAAARNNIARSTDRSSGKSAADSAAVFQRAGLTDYEQEQKRLADAGMYLRAQLNPLAAIQQRLNRELAELPAIARAGNFSVRELAAADALLRKNADAATRSLGNQKFGTLGLKPHELQNLSFQINDIFTQLASGASLTQTLAQQGGQIIQIFPRAGSSIASAFKNPYVLAFAATIGAIVIGIRSAADQAERLAGFKGFLASLADSGDVSADTLSDVSKELDRYGLSAKEALDITKALFREGFDANQIGDYGTLIKNVADVLGIDLKQATDLVVEGYTGNFEALDKLMSKTQSFTPAQRDQIRLLYEQGRASEAAERAFGILSDKMQRGADLARSDWSVAFRELGNGWDKLVEQLGDTWWAQAALDGVNALAKALDFLSGSSDRARESVANRSAAEGDPLAGFYGSGGNYYRKQGVTPPSSVAGVRNETAEQAANAQRIRQELEIRADLEGEITSQKAIQRRLDALARQEYAKLGNTVSKVAADEIVANKLRTERVRLEKELVRYQKQQADEAERLAKQTRFMRPVDGKITSGFGLRARPKAGASTFHQGIDFAVPIGTSVRAPASGVVIQAGTDAKLGRFVFIDHGNNVVSKFGHLSDNAIVKPGQFVSQGQTIGRSGNSGNSTGPHLHFAVTVNGKPVDPLKGAFPKDGPSRFEINAGEAVADLENQAEKDIAERARLQDRFNETLADEADRRRQNIAALQAEQGLQGVALIAEQRRTAIAEAMARAQERLDDTNAQLTRRGLETIAMTDAQREAVENLTGSEFDLAHARDLAQAGNEDAERNLNNLTAQRDALQTQVDALRAVGDQAGADSLETKLRGVNDQIRIAIEGVIQFYMQLDPATDPLHRTQEQIDATIARLRTAQTESRNWVKILGVGGRDIAQVFTNSAGNAIGGFLQKVAAGKNVFRSLLDAFRQFAADFLLQIAQMIMQQILFNVVTGWLSGGIGAVGGGGGTSLGAVAGLKAHSGGIIGGSGPQRVAVNPAWFADAVRYHNGGIAGLKPNEVATILEKGEEVLTTDNPRHAANGGPGSFKIVNAVDGSDALEQALRTRKGEKVLLNYIRDNAGAVKQALG